MDHTPGHRSGRIIYVHALTFAKETEHFSPGRGTKAISLVPGDWSMIAWAFVKVTAQGFVSYMCGMHFKQTWLTTPVQTHASKALEQPK